MLLTAVFLLRSNLGLFYNSSHGRTGFRNIAETPLDREDTSTSFAGGVFQALVFTKCSWQVCKLSITSYENLVS